MFSALFRFVRGFFRLLGRLIDFTRRVVVNLVFLLFVLMLVLMFSRPQLPLPESQPLLSFQLTSWPWPESANWLWSRPCW